MSEKKLHKIAKLSLIFGFFVVIPLLGYIFSLAALILGIMALVKIAKSPQEYRGKDFAIAGIILGLLGGYICSLSSLIFFAQCSAVAPFIYTLF